jgi:hypothetical protein
MMFKNVDLELFRHLIRWVYFGTLPALEELSENMLHKSWDPSDFYTLSDKLNIVPSKTIS